MQTDSFVSSNNAPVTISLVHVYNISELFSPTGGVAPLWGKTYPVDTMSWSFPMVKGAPNVTVEEVRTYLLGSVYIY